MPVKKIGKKWEVGKELYDTEAEAIKAYQAYLNAAMGIPPEKPGKKAGKSAATEDEQSKLNDKG